METNYEKNWLWSKIRANWLTCCNNDTWSFIIGLLVQLLVRAFEAAGGDAAAGVGGFLAGWILSIPITSVLYSFIEGFTGASPAKMMFGIKVGNEDGTEANVKTYMTRWAFYNGQGLISILTLIGLSFLSIVGLYMVAIFVGCFLVLGEKNKASMVNGPRLLYLTKRI